MMMTVECKRRPRYRHAALAALLLACSAPATGDGLAGRIWSPPHGTFVGEPVVRASIARADFLVLGETHTLARHHRLQARLLRLAADGGRRPAVVLEMVRHDQQDAIDAWRRAGADPAAFGDAVAWTQRGWPEWPIYQPIVEAAIEHGLDLHGGGPASDTLETVARGGLGALERATRRRLGLDEPLPEPARRRLRDTLAATHCGAGGHVPLDRMLAVQRLRDATMAARLRAVADRGGVVLITGNGHARRDHGVSHYLGAGHGDRHVLSIAIVAAGDGDSLETQRARAGGSLPFDYVWFTAGEPPVADCPDDAGDDDA